MANLRRAKDHSISATIFEYLKRSVSNLVEPFKSTKEEVLGDVRASANAAGLVSNLSESQPQFSIEIKADTQVPVDIRFPTHSKSIKRRRQLTPCNSPKRSKCAHGFSMNITVQQRSKFQRGGKLGLLTPGPKFGEKDQKERMFQLKSSFTQLLWILQHLKHNPLRTDDDVLVIVFNLCDGIAKIIGLSRLNLPDTEFRRFIRFAETLFNVVHAYARDESCKMQDMQIRIYDKMEDLFDNFLDQLSHDDLNVEGKLRTYGVISGLPVLMKDTAISKILVEKLLLRVNAIVVSMWTACVFSKDSNDLQQRLMNPSDIDLFYFYCQLLQVTITVVQWDPCQCGWMEQTVVKGLSTLEEAGAKLFALLPNLSYILVPAILAANQVSNGIEDTGELENKLQLRQFYQ